MEDNSQSATSPPATFENALSRLETLVQQLENGDLPLSEAVARFQEGMEQVRFCRQQLEAAHKQVNLLLEDDNGAIQYSNGPSLEDTDTAHGNG